jgi:hypothetical protein
MDMTIQWFFLVKLFVTFIGCYTVYVAYKAHWKSRLRNVIALFSVLIWLIVPVKMDTKVYQQQQRANHSIEQSKVLPERVTDNSFKEAEAVDHRIKEEFIK